MSLKENRITFVTSFRSTGQLSGWSPSSQPLPDDYSTLTPQGDVSVLLNKYSLTCLWSCWKLLPHKAGKQTWPGSSGDVTLLNILSTFARSPPATLVLHLLLLPFRGKVHVHSLLFSSLFHGFSVSSLTQTCRLCALNTGLSPSVGFFITLNK